MSTIRPIAHDVQRRLVAGQAVTDLASAVKELVDNALDAGARNINVRLFDQGLHILEVSDDGSGVPRASRPFLATPHATSKIQQFEDIYSDAKRYNDDSPESADAAAAASSSAADDDDDDEDEEEDAIPAPTLGFRGEALFCLANLSYRLIVATRTAGEDLAQKMEFDRSGTLDPACTVEMAKKVGTTVAVCKLMQAVPVRRADLRRRIQAHRSRMIQLMEAYACFSVGVRLCVMDMLGKNLRESTIIATTLNNSSLRETVSAVFGPRVLAGLSSVEIDIGPAVGKGGTTEGKNEAAADETTASTPKQPKWKITGLVSNATPGRSRSTSTSADRQLFSINRRPVELPKFGRLLNEVWRSHTSTGDGSTVSRPMCVLELTLPPSQYDVNLNPDKRQVILTHEKEIMELVQKRLSEFWASQTEGQFMAANQEQLDSAVAVAQEDESSKYDYGKGDVGSPTTPGSIPATPQSPDSNPFKRRYAFSHDVAKARLQHQYEDERDSKRQKLSPRKAALKSAVHSGASMAAEEPTNQPSEQNQDVPSERGDDKKEKLALTPPEVSFGDVENQPVVTASRNEESRQSKYSSDASSLPLSASERSKWREVQRSFRSSGNDLACEIEMIDGASGRGERDKRNQRIEAGDKPGDKSKDGKAESRPPSSSPSQFGLEQFGFGYRGRRIRQQRRCSASTGQPEQHSCESGQKRPRHVSIPNNSLEPAEAEEVDGDPSDVVLLSSSSAAEQTAPTSKLAAATVSGRADHEQQVSSSPTSKRPRHVSMPQANEHAQPESDAMDRRSSKRSICSTDIGTDNDDDDVDSVESAAKQSDDREGDKKKPPTDGSRTSQKQPVHALWHAVSGTEDVLLAARRAALAVRDRTSDSQAGSVDDAAGVNAQADDTDGENGEPDGKELVSLSKDDLGNLTVIGQFNLGFILARSASNDLWILDQHACDERTNFEKLCRTTQIREQRLLRPLPLEDLTAAEETCVLDNMELFEKNGFRFQVDLTRPPRQRLALTALPHSGAENGRNSVQFGKEDVSALCNMLGVNDDDYQQGGDQGSTLDGAGCGTGTDGSGKYGNNAVRRHYSGRLLPNSDGRSSGADSLLVRLPKAIAMFASRACRSSIMIGTALTKQQMDRVIQKLAGDVQQPWTCAHGRPTMQHVGSLQRVLQRDSIETGRQFAAARASPSDTETRVQATSTANRTDKAR